MWWTTLVSYAGILGGLLKYVLIILGICCCVKYLRKK